MKNTTAATEPQAVRTIGDIQRALAERFGMDVETDTGRATLSLARDRVELTDQNGKIIATDFESVTALIGSREPTKITVTLDALATKMVRWYADKYGREIADVVSGVLAGCIGHLHEQEEKGNFRDDTAEHLGWYLVDAIQRRKALSKAA